jgi:hypothetical protein
VQLGLTAIHCASTLLQASLRPLPSPLNAAPAPSPILQHLALHLLPPLITFISETVVHASTSSSGNSDTNLQLEELRETIKALVNYSSSLPDEHKPKGYAILLPTLCLLLDPPDEETQSALHLLGTTTLLGLAQREPKAFKDATQAMGEGERSGLEIAVREAVGRRAGVASGGAVAGAGGIGAEKKGIELRSFG